MAPQFRLLQACVKRVTGNFDDINGLLGCGVQLFSPDVCCASYARESTRARACV
jgi:hypothetical protein